MKSVRRTMLATSMTIGLLSPALAADDPLSRVLSAVQVELSDAHIGRERAVLVASADPEAATADLHVYAGGPDAAMGSLILRIDGIAYDGSRTADAPALSVNGTGSLVITSAHMGIGRTGWERSVTATERAGQIVLAGLTEATWDKISNANVTCDWNALTGAYVVEEQLADENGPTGAPIRRSGTLPERYSLADWAAAGASAPEICQSEVGQ